MLLLSQCHICMYHLSFLEMGMFSCFFCHSFYSASSCPLCNCHVIVWQAEKQKSSVFSVESSRRALPRQIENDCLNAIGMIQAGMLYRAVAMQCGVHINTIQTLWRRFQQFGIVRDRQHAGHPTKTTQKRNL